MLTEIPIEQYTGALDQCAEDALWEASIDAPPIDAFQIARRLRLGVISNEGLTERARFVRTNQGGVNRQNGLIVLGPEDRPERRQWAVAHEIGEAIAFRVFETLGVSPEEAPPLERERVANSLAGRLLTPKKWLAGVARDADLDLIALKEIFVTASHELIARRLLECRRTPLIVSVFDNGRLTWRRWNLDGAPSTAPPLLDSERDCQQQTHDTKEPCWGQPVPEDRSESVHRFRCWPIHEPDWRREILFTELIVL